MRWLKITGLIIGLVILLSCAGIYYLKTIFIPGPFKEILISRAQEALHRNIQIQDLSFALTRGVVLKGVEIKDPSSDTDSFLSIAEVDIGIPPPRFLTGGRLVIPYAKLIEPTINLKRKNVNEWNFSDLLAKRMTATESSPTAVAGSTPPTPKVVLGLVSIQDGKINIDDKVTGVQKNFRDLNVSLHTGILGGIIFEAGTQITDDRTKIRIQGSFAPSTLEIKANLSLENLNVGELAALAGKINSLSIVTARVNSLDASLVFHKGDLTLDGNMDAQLDVLVQTSQKVNIKTQAKGHKIYFNKSGRTLKIQGQVSATASLIDINDRIHIAGEPQWDHLDLTIDIGKGMKASGDLTLNAAKVNLDAQQTFSGNWSAKNFHFNVENDQIEFYGQVQGQNTSISFLNSEVTSQLSWESAVLKKSNTGLTVSGDLALNQGKYKINGLVAQGDLRLGKCLLTQQGKNFKLFSDYVSSFQAKIQFANRTVNSRLNVDQLSVSFQDDVLQAEGHIKTQNFEMIGPDQIKFSGNPELKFGLTYGTLLTENPWSFNGKLTLSNETLQGLPVIDSLNNLSGKLDLTSDSIMTDSLAFRVADHAITLSGNLKNINSPQANATLTCPSLDLSDVSKYFPQLFEVNGIQISGKANQIIVKFNGPVKTPLAANIKASAAIKDALIKIPSLPSGFSNINGALDYHNQTLAWNQLTFQYQEVPYTSSGTFQNPQEPTIRAQLQSGDFDLSASAQKTDNIFTISSLKGVYHDTFIDVKGTVALTNQLPDLDLSGQVILNLIDLNLLPGMGDQMKAVHPLGDLTINGRVTLPKLSLDHLDVDLKLSSKKLSLYGYQTSNLNASIQTLTDGRHDTNLSSTVYDGAFQLSGQWSWPSSGSSSDWSASILNLNLAQLKTAIPSLKEKDFSGILSAEFNGSGKLADLNSLLGNGAIKVTEGRLLELNLLKGIWKYLLIKDFKSIVFTEARANFRVKNGRVFTDDLVIKSDPLDCNAAGWIDFKNTINFKINADIHESPIAALEGVKVAPTAILAQAQNLIELEVSGPISSPEIKKNVTPLKAIKKTTGSILQGLGGMLEDMIEK